MPHCYTFTPYFTLSRMKNQYFGDIHDYRKYGLLRAILCATELSLGVCWLLTDNDGTGDGKNRKYLQTPKYWSRFDSELYESLSQLGNSDIPRAVKNAKSCNLLPRASYYSETVPGNREQRPSYLNKALKQLRGTDLLFFDPDNGIEVPSVKYGTKKSPKYVYWREIEEAYRRKHSVIIYQHFPRKPRDEFIATKIDELRNLFPGAQLSWFRTKNVVFLAAFQPKHSAALCEARDRVIARWPGQICVGV